jgi:hypothetical protein
MNMLSSSQGSIPLIATPQCQQWLHVSFSFLSTRMPHLPTPDVSHAYIKTTMVLSSPGLQSVETLPNDLIETVTQPWVVTSKLLCKGDQLTIYMYVPSETYLHTNHIGGADLCDRPWSSPTVQANAWGSCQYRCQSLHRLSSSNFQQILSNFIIPSCQTSRTCKRSPSIPSDKPFRGTTPKVFTATLNSIHSCKLTFIQPCKLYLDPCNMVL